MLPQVAAPCKHATSLPPLFFRTQRRREGSILLRRHKFAAKDLRTFRHQMNINAPGTMHHGVGIMIFRRARGKAADAVTRQHRRTQNTNEAAVTHTLHLFVIRRRKGQGGYVLAHGAELYTAGLPLSSTFRPDREADGAPQFSNSAAGYFTHSGATHQCSAPTSTKTEPFHAMESTTISSSAAILPLLRPLRCCS